jgi:AbiV family abortive infection protein
LSEVLLTLGKPTSTPPTDRPSTCECTFAAEWGMPNDPAIEVLSNALRLACDSRLLFNNGRFPSSASLAVLAIEEFAKFMSLAGFQPLPRSEWHIHTTKHRKALAFLLRKRFQSAWCEITGRPHISIDDHKAINLALKKHRQEVEDANFDTAVVEANADNNDEELKAVKLAIDKALSDEKLLLHYISSYLKKIETLKRRGFYVDIGSKMKVSSTPAQITQRTAKELLDLIIAMIDTLMADMGDIAPVLDA